MGKLSKHGVKQVDRLLSNQGIEVWKFFGYWVPYMVGARAEVVVALDWTSFARDGHETIVISMLTGHGRATPLLWKTVESSKLKGKRNNHEDELLYRLHEVTPEGVKVTVVADRGFADCSRFEHLAGNLGFEYVIRLRGNFYVTHANAPDELADTVLRTLALPPIASLRNRLVPEAPLYASEGPDRALVLTAGIADAVTLDDGGRIELVLDWKSDVRPTPRSVGAYRAQMLDYLRAASARLALIVFLSTGQVEAVTVPGT